LIIISSTKLANEIKVEKRNNKNENKESNKRYEKIIETKK